MRKEFHTVEQIRVAIDGSPHSERALSHALRLAEALATTLRADLVVAHVYPLQFDFAGPARVDAEWRAYLLEESQETLDWAAGHLDQVAK